MSELMNDFFKVSQDEIDAVENDGKLKIEKGKDYTFQITELKEKAKDDHKLLIVVLIEAKTKLEYAMFIKSNKKPSVKSWMELIKCFFSDNDIRNGFQRTSLIGKTFTATGDARDYNGKTYTDIKNFKAVANVPGDVDVASVGKAFDSTAIPF